MTLAEYDAAMQQVHDMEVAGRALLREACRLEQFALRQAGVEWVSREPGFLCWRIDGKNGWFRSPREAIAAQENPTA